MMDDIDSKPREMSVSSYIKLALIRCAVSETSRSKLHLKQTLKYKLAQVKVTPIQSFSRLSLFGSCFLLFIPVD